jgi:hypothetical protein
MVTNHSTGHLFSRPIDKLRCYLCVSLSEQSTHEFKEFVLKCDREIFSLSNYCKYVN